MINKKENPFSIERFASVNYSKQNKEKKNSKKHRGKEKGKEKKKMVTFACVRMSELALLKRQNTLKENEGSYSLQHIHPWCKLTTFIVTRNLFFFFLSFLHFFVYIDIYTKLSLLLLLFFFFLLLLLFLFSF